MVGGFDTAWFHSEENATSKAVATLLPERTQRDSPYRLQIRKHKGVTVLLAAASTLNPIRMTCYLFNLKSDRGS
jgi:hypothetical protein